MLLEKPTTRRKFLLGALLALPVSDLLLKGVTAAQAAEMAAPELADYKPIFFSASEWQFILAATDRLIPAGGSGKAPGALENQRTDFYRPAAAHAGVRCRNLSAGAV